MMTLAQMSNFICSKVGQFDSVAIALCKDYLAARYRMVWDDYFWKDSQAVVSVSVAIDEDSFPYPIELERIVSIGISGSGELLDPVDDSFLLEAAPEVFQGTGVPQYYQEYVPTGIPGGVAEEDDLVKSSVHIFPAASKSLLFHVFGKRKCPALCNDDGVSILRNCDNAIIAFAMGDMLERLRQFAKAQAKFAEAKELLEQAKSVERDQANRPRRNKNLTVVGNSLAEMTDAVCAICGVWTPDVRVLAREFLRRNYVSLYQMILWPETTVVVRVAYSGEQVILPHFVDRVLAAHTADGTRLMPNEVSYLFAVSPTIFKNTGAPLSMSILTPVAVGTLPLNPPEALLIASSETTDNGKRVFIRGESGGTEVTEEVILGSTLTERITQYAYDVPLTISKPITDGDVTVNGAISTQLYQFIPAGERERKHIRLWILPPPPASANTMDCEDGCMILGKRKITPLRSEEDTPIITGAQGVLIAGAVADLFTRLGNNESANIYRTRAEASAKVLVLENTDQSAYSPKIVPVIEPSALGIDSDYCWSKQ